jgi:hypothetical protein
MHAIYVFPSKLFNGIYMATVSYSRYHVRLVSLEGVKILGSNLFCSTTSPQPQGTHLLYFRVHYKSAYMINYLFPFTRDEGSSHFSFFAAIQSDLA